MIEATVMADIDKFLQQVLADQREMEADPTPQTPTYALLAAGKLEEAEAVARKAVSDLEKENAATSGRVALDEQYSAAENDTHLVLLADALIAHGIALARLKKLEAAQARLERAIAVALQAGAPDKAGLGALTMIEELEELSRETLLSAYELASLGMAEIRNRKLQWRVIVAAKKVMASFWGEVDSDRALEILLARPAGSKGALIDQALTQSNGSKSETASLAHSDACMTCIIELRYKGLFKKRTKVRRRSRKA
jgi:tetratricopeptide (TPR) repeat protein